MKVCFVRLHLLAGLLALTHQNGVTGRSLRSPGNGNGMYRLPGQGGNEFGQNLRKVNENGSNFLKGNQEDCGGSNCQEAVIGMAMNPIFGDTLSNEEETDLNYLRSEEKLAHEVYQVFAEKYKHAQVFDNIVYAEQRHMDLVLKVIDYFGIGDNLEVGYTRGQYPENTFNSLFTYLVEQGNKGLVQALRVGVVIQELHNAKLKEAIASTNDKVLGQVYQNLSRASDNHLRAFVTNLVRAGELSSDDDYKTDVDIQTMLGNATAVLDGGNSV